MKQSMDGIDFELAESRDFSFLRQYGQVFEVFDQNDSGNISFSLQDEAKKRFVKIAGAKTINANHSPEQSVKLLKESVELYHHLSHPQLITLMDCYELETLFVCVFEWVEGECLHDHWNFDYYREHNYLRPIQRFIQLPVREKYQAYLSLLEFIGYVHEKGYVAIDLYLGSLIYDFTGKQLRICDIDYFAKKPYINRMGRMWGSSSVMSFEEFESGATIDEKSNVFTLAKIAKIFFGSSADVWTLSPQLYRSIEQALHKDPKERLTLMEYHQQWRMEI